MKQRGWLGGFDAGASYGSAIAVEAGVEYVLRLVLKSAASAMPSQGGAVVASLASETGTLLWSHEYPWPLASAGWATVNSVLNVTATTTNATLSVAATAGTVSKCNDPHHTCHVYGAVHVMIPAVHLYPCS